MMKSRALVKKLIVVVLTASLIVSQSSVGFMSELLKSNDVSNVSAATNRTFSEIKSMLDSKMQQSGYKPGGAPPGSYTSGSGCYGFCDMLTRYLFGHGLPSQATDHYSFKSNYTTNYNKIGNTLTVASGNLNAGSLKTLFSQAQPGDVVQMDYTPYSGGDSLHTMMVYSVSDSGVVFYHAGSSKVYFGQSTGTQKLWGTNGSVLTWSNMLGFLKSSDDGISLYRSKYAIANDTTAPQITDVWVTDLTTSGYWVHCNVTDTGGSGLSYVQFPTWSSRNGQDDLDWSRDVANTSGNSNTVSFHVNINQHNNEHGEYVTAMYAYDHSGNCSSKSSVTVIVPSSYLSSEYKDYLVPQNYGVYNNHLYIVYNDVVNWATAERYAVQIGGHLASVGSASENDFIYNLISNQSLDVYFLGFTDYASEGTWKWSDNSDLTYTNWDSTQPDDWNCNENYLHMYRSSGRWNDCAGDVGNNSGFVVEIDISNLVKENVTTFKNHEFTSYSASVSWPVAYVMAKYYGGVLASIHSSEEDKALKELISTGASNGYYIGATDYAVEGTWNWSDGSVFDYQGWDTNQPDNYGDGQDYAALVHGYNGWDDGAQNGRYGFIVAKEIEVPTPTPTKNPTPTLTPTTTATPIPTENPTPTVPSTPTPTSVLTLTPTPSPKTATPTPVLTSTPKVTVPPMPSLAPSELNVGDFINRCYEVALRREADEVGYNYWVDSLNNGKTCGAQVGYGFIFSGEYLSKRADNYQFVRDLYTMYFGREADLAGYSYWVDQLNRGISREFVFAGFANSVEFNNLCNMYGVVSGVYLTNVPNDMQGGVNCFVARLYKVCLNRLPDQGGQAGWVQKLMNGEVTGSTAAYGFVFSPEFISMNLDNANYVAYMYRAFFGREADMDGFVYWVDKLDSGVASREDIFRGFSGSVEFANLCASYGIIV